MPARHVLPMGARFRKSIWCKAYKGLSSPSKMLQNEASMMVPLQPAQRVIHRTTRRSCYRRLSAYPSQGNLSVESDGMSQYFSTNASGTSLGFLKIPPFDTRLKTITGALTNKRFLLTAPMVDRAEDDPEWVKFSASWHRLVQDNFMGDGGTYRFRRYSNFEWNMNDQQLVLMPHMPLFQPLNFNQLNGDKVRWFSPLEKTTDRKSVV